MSEQHSDRRTFLKQAGAATGIAYVASRTAAAVEGSEAKLHLACNEYPWHTFYRRDGVDFRQNLDESIARVAKTGIAGFEPLVNAPGYLDQLVPLLKQNGLEMRSLYVNSVLHDPDQIEESIRTVLTIARRARELAQTRIIVTNPSPIQWGGNQDKSDDQLKRQAEALDKLGGKLRELEMTLAYHNHDAELRQAAREFHHMLVGTDPKNVTFCLDAHWVFRGSGDSSVALFDVLKLYGPRITELHLRQSQEGVWTESFGEGDIDYPALADYLQSIKVNPHIVLEQAVEQKTRKTTDAVTAQTQSRVYAEKVFRGFES